MLLAHGVFSQFFWCNFQVRMEYCALTRYDFLFALLTTETLLIGGPLLLRKDLLLDEQGDDPIEKGSKNQNSTVAFPESLTIYLT